MFTDRIMRKFTRRSVVIVLLVSALLTLPAVVWAHPADQYLQASYLTVGAGQIQVELDLTPGPLIAARVMALIDADADGTLTDAEMQAYARAILTDQSLTVDGAPLPLRLVNYQYPTVQALSAGFGSIRIDFDALMPAAQPGTVTSMKHLIYHNTHLPALSVYQGNAFTTAGSGITLGAPQRDALQQVFEVDFGVPVSLNSATTSGASATGKSATIVGQDQLLSYLNVPSLPPLLLLTAFLLAVLLGGLHALTPGHGKTLLAAYLVGSRGTTHHAVALGGIITLTHTFSVIVFGAIALAASQSLMPGVLIPLLEIGTGLLVTGLGLRLVWLRFVGWRSVRGARSAHPHDHVHALPAEIRWRDLWALGISGGVIPCPEALGILLIAVSLNRIAFGMGLIVAFSLGLAAVLIAIGLLLVRSRSVIERRGWSGGRLARFAPLLPLCSAGLVSILGAAIAINGLVAAAVPPDLIRLLLAGLSAVVVTVALLLIMKARLAPVRATAITAIAHVDAFGAVDPAMLPPRYRDGAPVCKTPMAAAPLRFDANGDIAWDEIWTDFCDLALAGGPPHRGTLLEPVSAADVQAEPIGYARVMAETARGLRMVSGLSVVTDGAPGWVGLVCDDESMAIWLLRAIIVENVSVRREANVLYLPVGPHFERDKEIKNVVTVVAKTSHYYAEHRAAAPL